MTLSIILVRDGLCKFRLKAFHLTLDAAEFRIRKHIPPFFPDKMMLVDVTLTLLCINSLLDMSEIDMSPKKLWKAV